MKAWEKMLVPPSLPIFKVVRLIESGAIKIALVADSEKHLLGTVTDGDIRRGILKGLSLEDPVAGIMKKNPLTVSPGEIPENIRAVIRKRHIHQIPIVDRRNRILDVEVVDEFLEPLKKDNWVVLMAGGLGRRLSPLTDDVPKPLLPVGKKPLLETILEQFAEQGFCQFFMTVNYKEAMVCEYFGDGARWGVRIEYIRETKRLGTAGALGLLPRRPENPMIVMNADLLTRVNFIHLLNFHREHQAKATMGVRDYSIEVPYGVAEIKNHQVKNINEKPVNRFFVNAGIYVLDPEVLGYVPHDTSLDMPALLMALVRDNRHVAAFPIHEYWIDIGRMDDLERANGEFASIFESMRGV